MSTPATHGYSLLELAVVLALAAVLAGMALPFGRHALDEWAVRSTRDQALAALHRVRMESRLRGGARLELRASDGLVRGWSQEELLFTDRSAADSGVRLHLTGDRESVELEFDALGLGIVASRTLLFRRGRAEALLVISSRGRGSRR